MDKIKAINKISKLDNLWENDLKKFFFRDFISFKRFFFDKNIDKIKRIIIMNNEF